MYTGRFAPSPTGPLHAGSLVCALASWLDARAHGGRWLLRIEDVDTTRCSAAAAQHILWQLQQHGLHADAAQGVMRQSQRGSAYAQALQALQDAHLVYPCHCSRAEIARALDALGAVRQRGMPQVYPGSCRLAQSRNKPSTTAQAAWRLDVQACTDAPQACVHWSDRLLGAQQQCVAQAVGDFVLRRADGVWAYQLAVVVDDAAQGVTHVVRGQDLCESTAGQMLLQRALHLPSPLYLHTPLVYAPNGEKLSKQNGARALDASSAQRILRNLQEAAAALHLPAPAAPCTPAEALAHWTRHWRARYVQRL